MTAFGRYNKLGANTVYQWFKRGGKVPQWAKNMVAERMQAARDIEEAVAAAEARHAGDKAEIARLCTIVVTMEREIDKFDGRLDQIIKRIERLKS